MKNLTIVAALACLTLPARAAEPEPSPEVRRELIRTMGSRVNALLAERNASGAAFRRGTFSRKFTAAGPDGYRTVLHVDTAEPASLVTERIAVTLAPSDGGGYRIAAEQVEDTYTGLERGVPGDETFHHFAGLSLEREGLRVRAGAGWLFVDPVAGRAQTIVVTATDLAYDYEPPLPLDKLRHGIVSEKHRDDLQFDPERLTLACDPATCDEVLRSAFKEVSPATEEGADPALRAALEQRLDELKRERERDPFSGFFLPWEADHRFLLVSLKRKGRDQHFALESDSHEPREVSIWVSDYGRLHWYHAKETREGKLSAADRERRPDPDRRTFDVQDVKGSIELGFGDGQQLSGDVVVSLRMLRAAREVPFRFASFASSRSLRRETQDPGLRIDSIADDSGRELTWVKTGGASGLVILPETPAAGSLVRLHMSFESADTVYKLTPNFYYVARSGWLPFVNVSDILKGFDMVVKVPARFKPLTAGAGQPLQVDERARSVRFSTGEPLTFPAVIFGGYRETASKVKAVTGTGAEIPVRVHVNKDSSVGASQMQAAADRAANSLNLYERLFGTDYAYGSLNVVDDPTEGLYGQSPAGLIFLGSGSHTFAERGPRQLTKPEVERFQRSVVPHEVAHQWWGSLIASAGRGHRWFEEALAQYSAALYAQASHGVKEYLTMVEDWRAEILETEMPVSLQDAEMVWDGDQGGAHAALYAKGPYLFHMMRSIWGDDRFMAFLRALATEHRGREIVTMDIQRTAEKSFGEPLGWFFDQWVRDVGVPRFTLRHSIAPAAEGGWAVEGEVEQKVLLSPKLRPVKEYEGRSFRCEVFLVATDRTGKEHQQRLDLRGPVTPFRMVLPEKPRDVALNKYGETLAHDIIEQEKP